MKALRNRGSFFWPQTTYRPNSLKGVTWVYYTGFRVYVNSFKGVIQGEYYRECEGGYYGFRLQLKWWQPTDAVKEGVTPFLECARAGNCGFMMPWTEKL